MATILAHLYLRSFCHSSLQILSNLDREHRCTAIFRSLQRCSIGIKSGPLKNIQRLVPKPLMCCLGVCLGFLSCWKVNLPPQSEVLSRFSSRIFLYFAPFIFPSILTSLPVPAIEKHPHNLMLAGRSLGGSKLLPFKNDGGHNVLGDLQCCRHILVPFRRSVPRHNPVSELYGQFL